MSQQFGETRFDVVRKAVRRHFPSLIVVSCVVNLLLLVSAIYMLQVYDRVLASGSLHTLGWLTLIALGALVVYGLLEQVRRIILGRSSAWVETELSEPVLHRIMSYRLAGRNPAAHLRDVSNLKSFIGGDAILAFLDAPWTPVFVAFIWLLHPGLGVLALGSVVVLFLFALANDLWTRRPLLDVAQKLHGNGTTALNYVENGETISPLGMTKAVIGRWDAAQRTHIAEQQRLKERTSGIVSASRALRLALQVMILGLGAFFVLQGTLTAGGMIAGSIILGRALAPIERSIGAWQSFVAARDSTARLKELFDTDDRREESLTLPRPKGALSVEDVYYLAPESGTPILENISFTLAAGETLAVIGPSGSGKSTLCRLLVGALQPKRGHVRLDGADVSSWDPEELGPHLGYLPQDVRLFPGTVSQNIARMRDLDDSMVLKAAHEAGVHDLVLRLPDGYETDVGLYGARISGGQRQRLGLARALLGDPAFIVLDEPGSNLDQAGEAALNTALDRLKTEGRTVVIVTHRAAALRNADKILVMQNGTVAAFGPRDEILKIRSGPAPVPPPAAGEDAPKPIYQSVFNVAKELQS